MASLQQLFPKQGAAGSDLLLPLLRQGGLAVSHWHLVNLRNANNFFELLVGEAEQLIRASGT